MLRIELLGEFRALEDGVPLEALAPRRLQLLVAYLALHAGTPLPRRSVAFVLWPDTSEQQALTNLRNLLHILRRALPDPDRHLEIGPRSIGWRATSDAAIDVVEFESCLEDAGDGVESVELAVAIPRGELLSHFDDEWIEPHRLRLRGLLLGALDRLADLHAEQGDCARAIAATERRLRIDRFSEEAHRRLIALHLANDDRGAALLAYHACARMLAEEFGSEPAPSTRLLAQQLLEAGDPRGILRSHLAMAPRRFVGRSAEWQHLLEAWREAASGHATSMLVLGEAGMGKTRLAREFLTQIATARPSDAAPLVLEARAYPTAERLPYAPIVDWLRSPALATRYTKLAERDLTELARFVPELSDAFHLDAPAGPIPDAWGRQRAFEAMAAALVSPDGPTLLFLDDLQWADGDTLDFLVYVLERRSDAALLVLATARTEALAEDGAAAAWRETVAARGHLEDIELPPFNLEETSALASQVLTDPASDSAMQRLFEETEGHPLFILETLRATGLPAEDAPSGKRGVPRTVRSVIRERLRLLSPEGASVAGAAAVIGRVFSLALLRETADVDEGTLVRGLDDLWSRRVVREHGDGSYDFTHDRLREVAYADVAPARRRDLHRRVALALEAAGDHAPHAEVAYHFERAGSRAEAARHFILAAQAARRVYANAEALKHYRSALDSWPEGADLPLDHSAVEQEVGDLELLASRIEEAEAAYQRALAKLGTQPLRAAVVHRKRAVMWLYGRQFARALEAIEHAEDLFKEASRDSAWDAEWISLQTARMEYHYWIAAPSDALRIAHDLEPRIANSTPDQRQNFFATKGIVLLRHSRFAETREAIRALDHARDIAAAYPESAPYVVALFTSGFARVWGRQLDEAEHFLLDSLRLCEERGELLVRDRCLSYLTLANRFRGDVAATRAWALRSLESATQMGTADYVAMAQAHLGWCAWRKGDTASALKLFQEAQAQWLRFAVTAFEWPFQWAALWPLMAIRLDEGDLPAALECADKLLDSRHLYLGEAIEAQLREAVAEGETEAAAHALHRAVDLAREQSWL